MTPREWEGLGQAFQAYCRANGVVCGDDGMTFYRALGDGVIEVHIRRGDVRRSFVLPYEGHYHSPRDYMRVCLDQLAQEVRRLPVRPVPTTSNRLTINSLDELYTAPRAIGGVFKLSPPEPTHNELGEIAK